MDCACAMEGTQFFAGTQNGGHSIFCRHSILRITPGLRMRNGGHSIFCRHSILRITLSLSVAQNENEDDDAFPKCGAK